MEKGATRVISTQKKAIPVTKPSSRVGEQGLAWLFLLPYLVFYSWFMLYPIFKGFIISLNKWSIGAVPEFVGLRNYAAMLRDPYFWEALRHTILFVFLSTPSLVIVALTFALIVNSGLKGTTFLRSAFFLPYILSISVISSIWVFVLRPYTGLMNAMLHRVGVEQEIFWLSNSTLAWISILIATVWWTVGFNMVLFLAGLQEIPDDLYEAASIDGANRWHSFRYITLPSLRGVIALIVVLQSIASFKLFGQPWLMTQGGPGTATRPLVQYIYETGFRANDMGRASAMSYVLFLIMIMFAVIQLKYLSKRD
jgi:multiple sugar transport system permease protein